MVLIPNSIKSGRVIDSKWIEIDFTGESGKECAASCPKSLPKRKNNLKNM